MARYTNIQLSIAEGIAEIRIYGPGRRGVLDRPTNEEIASALRELEPRDDVGVLIITGDGPRVFVAGADVRRMRDWGRADGLVAMTSRVCEALELFPKVTIAAVNGAAMGGGYELALACDLRVAADHARFGQPEVGLGVIPAGGATQRLPRVIGLGRAKEMVLLGDPIDAHTALAWGLVTRVVPADELLPVARQIARRLLSRGPLALRLAKLALNASTRVELDAGLQIETLAQAICFESDDKKEGTSAFLEKRPPRFR